MAGRVAEEERGVLVGRGERRGWLEVEGGLGWGGESRRGR